MAFLLLADGDPNFLQLTGDFLERCGHSVERTIDPQQALEAIERQIPDLIICDVIMPRMDGYHFVRLLRSNELWRHIPVILLTAMTRPGERVQALQAGADCFLTKPFEPTELLGLIRGILEK